MKMTRNRSVPTLLNAGADFNHTTTPYDAGLGIFVDENKGDFIGKAALQNASREPRLTGITCETEPHIGAAIQLNGETVGKVTAGAMSPYLEHGVGIALLDTAGHAAGTEVMIGCIDGVLHKGQLADLPRYDKAGEIQRGKKVDIPVRG